MKFAFLIDDPSTMNTEKDTSYYLMLAAHQLGQDVFYFLQDSLSYRDEKVFADVFQVTDFATWPKQPVVKSEKTDLNSLNFIFVRKDPPFDRRYFYTTLLLDLLGAQTHVVNRPQALRDYNEKLGSLFFNRFTAQTLIASQASDILEFAKRFNKIVSKPIDGHGGRGIEIVESGQIDEAMAKRWTQDESRKIVVQEYVKQAEQGDKRILLFKGKPLGAILRVAAKPGQLNNLDQGGSAVACELSDRDREVCAAMQSFCIENGLDFVGIDMLGDYLTEVNVTSPTGLQELCRFSGEDFHHQMIKSYLEER